MVTENLWIESLVREEELIQERIVVREGREKEKRRVDNVALMWVERKMYSNYLFPMTLHPHLPPSFSTLIP